MTKEFVRVEAALSSGLAALFAPPFRRKLVHPEIRAGQLTGPDFPAVEDQEHIPGHRRFRQAEGLAEQPAERGTLVVEVPGAPVGHARGFAARRRSAQSRFRLRQDGEPDHINAQACVALFRQDFLLDFGGPPKAVGSSGIQDHQQADPTAVVIKGLAQRRNLGREESNRRRPGRRVAQEVQRAKKQRDNQQDGCGAAHRSDMEPQMNTDKHR